MSYTYKGSTILAPLTITSNEPILEVETVSLSTQRASTNAQRWELSFTVANSGNDEAAALLGAVTNMALSETMIMPQLPSVVAGNGLGASRGVQAGGSAGGTQVTVSLNGALKAGSFIKFSNHDKVYMVLVDKTTGSRLITVYPALRESVTTAHTFESGDNCVLTYYRDLSNLRGLTFVDGILSNPGVISLKEAI